MSHCGEKLPLESSTTPREPVKTHTRRLLSTNMDTASGDGCEGVCTEMVCDTRRLPSKSTTPLLVASSRRSPSNGTTWLTRLTPLGMATGCMALRPESNTNIRPSTETKKH